MNARAILFDMDGTLIDSEPLHKQALGLVLERANVNLPDGFAHASTGLSMLDVHALLSVSSALPLDYDTLVRAKYAAFLAAADTLQMRPGAAAAIALADSLECGYAIVSNSDRMLVDASLKAVGLLRPDMRSVTRNDVREGKPAAEPYLRAAWLLGVDPFDCIAVEDSPTGAVAGLAAGMTVVAWPEPHCQDLIFPSGVVHCRDDDLAKLLRSLLSATRTTGLDDNRTRSDKPIEDSHVSG